MLFMLYFSREVMIKILDPSAFIKQHYIINEKSIMLMDVTKT